MMLPQHQQHHHHDAKKTRRPARPPSPWLTSAILRLLRGRAGTLLAGAALLTLVLSFVPQFRSSALAQLKGRPGQQEDELGVSKRVAALATRLLDPTSPERQLKDQVFLGKAYLEQAQMDGNEAFAKSLDFWIQQSESFLASSLQLRGRLASDSAFLDAARPYIGNMSMLLLQARELHYDSAETMSKLRERMSSLEAKLTGVTSELASISQVAAESVPRSILCLSVLLGSQWTGAQSSTGPLVIHEAAPGATTDPSLFHFCIFSDNLLALAVAVNSTVASAAQPEKFVIHIITDAITFPSIQVWFSLHSLRGASLEVLRLEDVPWLNAQNVPVLRQMQDKAQRSFYFAAAGAASSSVESAGKRSDPVKFHNPKYMSLLNHGRFYLPQIYPALFKIVLLDDDIVVQQDLGPLFSLDLQGRVNGAVETCVGSQFHRFRHYLNFSDSRIASRFDPEGCAWAFGMNVFDLKAWRAHNLTSVYHFWQEQNADHTLWKLGTLPVGLLTFYGLTWPIQRSWHMLGLGYNKRMNASSFSEGAVIHWNGNLKPWLKIAIPKYRFLWTKFLNMTDEHLLKCGFA